MAQSQNRKCSRTTARGVPCKAWAVHGSDPPACAQHGGSGGPVQLPDAPVPDGLALAVPRSDVGMLEAADSPDILAVIADLGAKQQCLSRYIDECMAGGDASMQDIIRLLALHGQNAARLGRLLRDKQALSPGVEEERNNIIYQALDALAEEWGMDL